MGTGFILLLLASITGSIGLILNLFFSKHFHYYEILQNYRNWWSFPHWFLLFVKNVHWTVFSSFWVGPRWLRLDFCRWGRRRSEAVSFFRRPAIVWCLRSTESSSVSSIIGKFVPVFVWSKMAKVRFSRKRESQTQNDHSFLLVFFNSYVRKSYFFSFKQFRSDLNGGRTA